MRILVAEDQFDNREILARRLERRGHVLHFALNGAEAVEMTLGLLPELVLMDVSMPIMSGIDAARLLKENAATCDIPVIFLSAHAGADIMAECEAVGCDGFHTKPLDFAELLVSMDRVMAARV